MTHEEQPRPVRHKPFIRTNGGYLGATARDDLALETAVSRLSLEPAVSSVTWTTTEAEPALLAAAEE